MTDTQGKLVEREIEPARCAYAVGSVMALRRCKEDATFERHSRWVQGGKVRVTLACEAHRYPEGQEADTDMLWVVPRV